MMLLQNRKFNLLLCILFSVFALVWVVMSKPSFPVLSLFDVELPFRFPVIAFVLPCWLLYFNYKKIAVLWLLLIIPIGMAFNLNMLRPDLYLLWLFLIVLSLAKNKEQIFIAFLVIIGGMYFFTAVQKMHDGFYTGMASVFQKRILGDGISPDFSRMLAVSIPILEMLLALLCISPFKKTRMATAIILHTGILYFILMGGWNYGMVIWNMSLLTLHILLPAFDRKQIFQNIGVVYAPVVLSLLLPFLYVMGVGPSFSSWNMYSAKVIPYRLQIDEQTALNPPAYIKEFVFVKDGIYSVSINEWADYEIGTAPCMEPIFADRLMLECHDYIQKNK